MYIKTCQQNLILTQLDPSDEDETS